MKYRHSVTKLHTSGPLTGITTYEDTSSDYQVGEKIVQVVTGHVFLVAAVGPWYEAPTTKEVTK